MTEVKVPDNLWDTDTQAVITSWAYDDGSPVEQGDSIVEIMVEKAQYEIPAPASGTLRIQQQEGALVSRGAVIATIE